MCIRAGDWLIRQGDEADRLFVVVSGRLDVILESSPIRCGSSAAWARGGRRRAGRAHRARRGRRRCRAVRDSELLALDSDAIAAMFEDTPAFAAAMVKASRPPPAEHRRRHRRPPARLPSSRCWPRPRGVGGEVTRPPPATPSGGMSDVVALTAPPDGVRRSTAGCSTAASVDHDLVVPPRRVDVRPPTSGQRFCLRQADRVLVPRRAHTARPEFDPGTDLHVAICGPGRSAAHLAPWLDGDPPATHHHVDLGSYFEGDINAPGPAAHRALDRGGALRGGARGWPTSAPSRCCSTPGSRSTGPAGAAWGR